MKNNNSWTTKSGETIQIKDMTNEHLLNTLNFIWNKSSTLKSSLIKNLESEAEAAGCYSGGEMAEYYAHNESEVIYSKIGEINEDPRNLVSNKFPSLLKEADKRKIKFPDYYLDYVLLEEY